MALATFAPPQNPNVGVAFQRQPKVLSVAFGDGYEQRIAAGLNHQLRSFNLTWGPCTTTCADYIDTFMQARGGVEAFYWTPPRAASPVKVKCPGWARTYPEWNYDTVELTLVEVADLGS